MQRATKPQRHPGVLVSSTYLDLKPHRDALMEALLAQKLFPIGMERDVLRPDEDLISSSLRMVAEAEAYICLIGHRYGQCPSCRKRNPKCYSITRLEFEEARRLGLPTLVFEMSRKHLVTIDDIDLNPEQIRKLSAFRRMAKDGRIYRTFGSLEEFTVQATNACAELRRHIAARPAGRTRLRNKKASTSKLNEVSVTWIKKVDNNIDFVEALNLYGERIPTPVAIRIEPNPRLVTSRSKEAGEGRTGAASLRLDREESGLGVRLNHAAFPSRL